MNEHRGALARTTLLLNQEFFGGEADEAAIADALLASTVRLVSDESNLSCRAGQTGLITSACLIARMGIGLELDVPNVSVLDLAAPLRVPNLCDALVELGSDLVPGARVRVSAGPVDETFAFGCSPEGTDAVMVTATDLGADLVRGVEALPCRGDLPLGGFAAGAAVAAVALEAVMFRIEQAVGLPARSPRPSAGPPVRVRLDEIFPGLSEGWQDDLGAVDAISGGAITHALLFCLLRVPELRAHFRIVEEQLAELSNVNRYALLRASDDGVIKVDQLSRASHGGVEITGTRSLFTKATRDQLVPLASRVVIGVDDVEARWWVQEENPQWLAVGATGNHLAQLTTHVQGSPCAACLHSTPLPPQTIPTISFVSFWAGLLQACALLAGAAEPQNITVYPFALGGPSAVAAFGSVPNANCPLSCVASMTAAVSS